MPKFVVLTLAVTAGAVLADTSTCGSATARSRSAQHHRAFAGVFRGVRVPCRPKCERDA